MCNFVGVGNGEQAQRLIVNKLLFALPFQSLWVQRTELNRRSSAYEADELPLLYSAIRAGECPNTKRQVSTNEDKCG